MQMESGKSGSVAVGQKIPDANVLDLNGAEKNLLQLVAEGVSAIVFYQGHWCPWCRAQIRTYWQYHDELVDAGVRVAFISVDSPEVSAKFKDELEKEGVKTQGGRESHEIPFGIYCDPDRRATQALGIARESRARGLVSKPSIFIVSGDGLVRFVKVGQDYADRLSHLALIRAYQNSFSPADSKVG